jgi:Holliday junction resolvasome RuvABC ATP-dependent DNA helicase subunit
MQRESNITSAEKNKEDIDLTLRPSSFNDFIGQKKIVDNFNV